MYRAFGMLVSPAFDAYLRAQEEKERGHNSPFKYSIDDYEVSLKRIETELADFFDDFDWPRQSQA